MRTHVSFFAGIDAMSLATERLGYTTTFAVEIDPFCQKVIAKRFPSTKILGDIREVKGSDLGHVDLMTGGSPCQDLSSAGKGKGLDGDRSGLWFEYLRLIGEVRPSIALLENVAVLKSRGLDVVVNGLASIDYFCWWDCVPALAVGAPHPRDRIWVTAVPYETMPELDGEPFKEIRTKFPRAGASTAKGLIAMEPQATIKMCKEAMDAIKREDGVTWLTAIDQPLFPTPSSSSSYGSNRGGAAGRVGPIRHSLASMAKSGEWPESNRCLRRDQHIGDCEEAELCAHCDGSIESVEIPCFPTPTVGDSRNSRNSTAGRTPGGNHHDGTTLSDFTRIWPTPISGDANGSRKPIDGTSATGQRPNGTKAPVSLSHAIRVEEQRLWPTSSRRDWKDTGEGRMGRGQLPEAVRAESKLFPTPCATDYKGANPLSRPRGDDDLPTRIKRQEDVRVWPTPHGMSHPNAPRAAGPSGNELGHAVNEDQRLFPTPRRSDGERGGRGDLIQVVRGNKTDSSHGEQRLWPTAAAAADSSRGPGRSEHRNGGPNLRTAVADEKPGPLSPDWVEFLLGLPIGWTDLSVDDPIQEGWLSEHSIPRTLADVPNRKERLMAIGNSLVWKVAYTRIEQAHRLLGISIESVEDVA